MEYLVVDGYNVINAWKDVFDLERDPLEDCRDRFSVMLSNYQGFKNLNIMVVYDAHLVKGSVEKDYTYDNIRIIYTKENETADNYIEKFVHRYGNIHTIRVVTSDYLEQTMVLSNGGIRMSPRELKEEMAALLREVRPSFKAGNSRANAIESHIGPELLEKLEKIRRAKF